MAMQCPIIMGVQGEALRIGTEAQAAIPMTPESAEELTAAVEKLADDAQLQQQLGENGRRYVAEHFDRNRLAAKYLELLEEVSGKPGSIKE